jgi:2-iminobutanoate/2-iminopropanoate deaminase
VDDGQRAQGWNTGNQVRMDSSGAPRQAIETDQAPAPIGPYSQAIAADGVLFCSGQVPLDPTTSELVEGGIAAQARRCLENLEAVCEAAGARLADAARVGIYLTDMSLFGEVNEVYAEFFTEPYPVRITVGVAALPKGAQVEMDATVLLART